MSTEEWIVSALFFLVPNGLLACMELRFLSVLTEKQAGRFTYAAYALLLSCASAVESLCAFPFALSTVLELAALALFAIASLRCGAGQAAVGALLAITGMQAVNDLVLFAAHALPAVLPPAAATALSLGGTALFYAAAARLLGGSRVRMGKNLLLLLLPSLLALLTAQYGAVRFASGAQRGAEAAAGCLFQLACLISMLSVLWAYHGVETAQSLRLQNALLSRQSDEQRRYLAEVAARYQETRALRHDVKNHFLVIGRLLAAGDTDRAAQYVAGLSGAWDAPAVPVVSTGNGAVDALLSGKLGLARSLSIEVACAVRLPGGADDMDLCILFANALDNAITACRAVETGRRIELSGRRRGDFWMLDVQNTAPKTCDLTVRFGTGLSNVRAVAEKYGGAVSAERTAEGFHLSVLLLCPERGETPPAARDVGDAE